jgi:hypothetical protein
MAHHMPTLVMDLFLSRIFSPVKKLCPQRLDKKEETIRILLITYHEAGTGTYA